MRLAGAAEEGHMSTRSNPFPLLPQVRSAELVAVVGTVGAGKSSLLSAILNDISCEVGPILPCRPLPLPIPLNCCAACIQKGRTCYYASPSSAPVVAISDDVPLPRPPAAAAAAAAAASLAACPGAAERPRAPRGPRRLLPAAALDHERLPAQQHPLWARVRGELVRNDHRAPDQPRRAGSFLVNNTHSLLSRCVASNQPTPSCYPVFRFFQCALPSVCPSSCPAILLLYFSSSAAAPSPPLPLPPLPLLLPFLPLLLRLLSFLLNSSTSAADSFCTTLMGQF